MHSLNEVCFFLFLFLLTDTEKSKNIMKNIKNDVSDDGNADKLCLRATQICDIKKRPGSRVTAETITDVYTSNSNGNLIFLDLSLFRLPLESHTDFFRKYIIQNFLHATLIKCKYQSESFNTNSHIFVTTLSEYRYPLFIFKYEFTLHHVNMYRLTAEIVPTDGEPSELTVKSRLPSDFIGLDP